MVIDRLLRSARYMNRFGPLAASIALSKLPQLNPDFIDRARAALRNTDFIFEAGVWDIAITQVDSGEYLTLFRVSGLERLPIPIDSEPELQFMTGTEKYGLRSMLIHESRVIKQNNKFHDLRHVAASLRGSVHYLNKRLVENGMKSREFCITTFEDMPGIVSRIEYLRVS